MSTPDKIDLDARQVAQLLETLLAYYHEMENAAEDMWTCPDCQHVEPWWPNSPAEVATRSLRQTIDHMLRQRRAAEQRQPDAEPVPLAADEAMELDAADPI